MGDTGIEWTDTTWNPTSGCDRVSPGCDNCYALGMAKRLKAMGQPGYQNDGDPVTSGPGFALTVHPDRLDLPLKWRKPRKVFVNSMSDLFHKDVPSPFIAQVFAVMALAPHHTFQILTKRHARMRILLSTAEFQSMVWYHAGNLSLVDDARTGGLKPRPGLDPSNIGTWPLPNVWLGVSVEDQKWADIRIPQLLDTPAAVRWISAEPLLGPIDLHGQADEFGARSKMLYALRPGRPYFPTAGSRISGSISTKPTLDWVVAGGESGSGARRMHVDWARSLRDQCLVADVPFLFKQWGSWVPPDQMPEETWRRWEADHGGDDPTLSVRVSKGSAGRNLDDVTHDGYPAVRL